MDIVTLGKTPVSAENPAGEDVRYSPEFDTLQSEIDKLSVVTPGAGEVDWNRVLSVSATLLEKKSKNLLVAAYMAEALMKTRGFEGFVQGSTVLRDLVEHYWDTCFPPRKRKKGRLNAIYWWYDHAGKFLTEFEPSPMPQEAIDEIRQTLGSLDSLLSEKIEDAPVLRPLMQRLDRIPVEASRKETAPPEPEPEGQSTGDADNVRAGAETGEAENDPAPGSAPEESVAPSRSQPSPEKPPPASASPPKTPETGAAPREFQSPKDAKKALNAALDAMARLSTYYLKSDTAHPLAYRLNRIYVWLTVDVLPMVGEDGRTPLPPPDPMVKSSLESQLKTSEPEEAVRLAEFRLREHLFWLDLNRLAARGLEALGDGHAAAHAAVCRETAMFVNALPGIETLVFSDGTPFADSETRLWLKSIAPDPSGGGPADAPGDSPADTEASVRSRHLEIEAEAMQMVKKKNIVEAVRLFQESLACCGSGREKLLFRIGLCRMLLHMGKIELAIPHLETLEALIRQHGLEEWEPDLALQGLRLVHDGFSACSREDCNNKAGPVFDRIARISPAAAYTLCNT